MNGSTDNHDAPVVPAIPYAEGDYPEHNDSGRLMQCLCEWFRQEFRAKRP